MILSLLETNLALGLALKENLDVIEEIQEFLFPDEDINLELTDELHRVKIQ